MHIKMYTKTTLDMEQIANPPFTFIQWKRKHIILFDIGWDSGQNTCLEHSTV